MQDDFEYDALTFRAPQRTRWYTRLWPACLGHGCFGQRRPQFQLYLIGYDPVGQLQRAASMGDLASVQKYINGSEYHINEFDRRGRTSLHYASAHNHPNVVAWLVSNDCTDINIQDDEGCTPLIKATQRDNVECVSILLTHGANPHIVDFGGDAALHHAVVRGNIAIAGKLLKYKANIDTKTEYGLTPYKLALYERQHQMAEFLIKNGAEAHSGIKPNRISENPDVPESRTEDKGSTSAIKEDNEISSSRHTVEETKMEGFLPGNYDDGIVPHPTADTGLLSFQGPPGPPGPAPLPSINAINGPGGAPGPRRIPPPKPPRSKLQAPQKPPLSPPLPPRDVSAGPMQSISLPHPSCMQPGQPSQVEETKMEGFLPGNYDDGIVSQPTADTELLSFQGPPGPPGPAPLPSINAINGPGGAPGPRRIPPPKPPRSKLQAPQKPPLSPPLPPRDVSAGPMQSISLPHPSCMQPGQPSQVEETKMEGFLPGNYDDGIVPHPTADTELLSFQGPPGPPGPAPLPSINAINGPGGAPGPRRIPPPKPPRSKLQAPQKPPLSPPLPPRDVSAGPMQSISLPHPSCMQPGQPSQVEETKMEGFLPGNYDDGIVPHPTADTELLSFQGPLGPPGPAPLPSINAINGPGGAPGPRRIPPPKPPRSKLQAPQKPPLSPPLPPRDVSAGPMQSISLPHPSCMQPGQPNKVEETKMEGFLPGNYDDGIVPQPTADTELLSFQGPPGPPGPAPLPSINAINGPGGAPGPRRIPPPKPPWSKLQAPQKPPLSPPLPPRDVSAGPMQSISLPHPSCMQPGQPSQVEETKMEEFLPTNYDDGIVSHPTADTELRLFQGDAFDPQSASEYFSAPSPAEYTHYAIHSKVLPLCEATMALLMVTTGIWFLKFVSTVMMWVFNLI